MNGFVRDIRGREQLPADLAYRRPLDYSMVPEAERGVWIDADLCVIGEETFPIRDGLPITVHDAEGDFRWGLRGEG